MRCGCGLSLRQSPLRRRTLLGPGSDQLPPKGVWEELRSRATSRKALRERRVQIAQAEGYGDSLGDGFIETQDKLSEVWKISDCGVRGQFRWAEVTAQVTWVVSRQIHNPAVGRCHWSSPLLLPISKSHVISGGYPFLPYLVLWAAPPPHHPLPSNTPLPLGFSESSLSPGTPFLSHPPSGLIQQPLKGVGAPATSRTPQDPPSEGPWVQPLLHIMNCHPNYSQNKEWPRGFPCINTLLGVVVSQIPRLPALP